MASFAEECWTCERDRLLGRPTLPFAEAEEGAAAGSKWRLEMNMGAVEGVAREEVAVVRLLGVAGACRVKRT